MSLVADESDRIDVALVDLTMPGMSGADLARALRASNPSLRIVLTSGFSEDDADAHLRTHLADAFLPKPYRTADLMQVLEGALTDVDRPPRTHTEGVPFYR